MAMLYFFILPLFINKSSLSSFAYLCIINFFYDSQIICSFQVIFKLINDINNVLQEFHIGNHFGCSNQIFPILCIMQFSDRFSYKIKLIVDQFRESTVFLLACNQYYSLRFSIFIFHHNTLVEKWVFSPTLRQLIVLPNSVDGRLGCAGLR